MHFSKSINLGCIGGFPCEGIFVKLKFVKLKLEVNFAKYHNLQ